MASEFRDSTVCLAASRDRGGHFTDRTPVSEMYYTESKLYSCCIGECCTSYFP